MVAEHGHRTGVHDALDTRCGLGAIADDVAEAEHASHRKLLDVSQHGGEGVDVGVDVAEDGEEGVFGFRHGSLVGGGEGFVRGGRGGVAD